MTNIVAHGLNADAVLSIVSMEGQIVYNYKIKGDSATQLDLANLPKGVYIIRLYESKE